MKFNNIKIYLVQFIEKTSSQSFYKIGITQDYDVENRFKRDPGQYELYDIRVICSAYGPKTEVEELEQSLLKKYPKNLWVENKFSGVTEIVKLSSGQLEDIINIIKTHREQWYKERHK